MIRTSQLRFRSIYDDKQEKKRIFTWSAVFLRSLINYFLLWYKFIITCVDINRTELLCLNTDLYIIDILSFVDRILNVFIGPEIRENLTWLYILNRLVFYRVANI